MQTLPKSSGNPAGRTQLSTSIRRRGPQGKRVLSRPPQRGCYFVRVQVARGAKCGRILSMSTATAELEKVIFPPPDEQFAQFVDRMAEAVAPSPPVDIDEITYRHRLVIRKGRPRAWGDGGSPGSGNVRCPGSSGIHAAMSDSSPLRVVSIMGGVRAGKSQTLINSIYARISSPGSGRVVLAFPQGSTTMTNFLTSMDREFTHMRERGAPGLNILRDEAGEKGKDTIRVREYDRGNVLQIGLLSNYATLSGYDSQYIHATELDDSPRDLISLARGNPVKILMGRAAEDMANMKVLLESSPKLAMGQSLIGNLIRKADVCARPVVQCRKCNDWQPMDFDHLDFDRGATRRADIIGKVRYLCRKCKTEITPNDIRKSLLAGRWETGEWSQEFEWDHHGKLMDFEKPPGGAETFGAHMSLLYSLQSRNLEMIAGEWIENHGTDDGQEQFENEYLGLPVRTSGERFMEERALAAFSASTTCPTGIVPKDAVELFCGVDVESRGFQIMVIGIGPGVVYIVDRFNLFGPDYAPQSPISWARLGYKLMGGKVGSGIWLGEDGTQHRLFATQVDFMGDANRAEGLPWMEGALRFCEDARAGGILPNGRASEYFRPGAVAANYNVFAVRGHSSAQLARQANWPVKGSRHNLPGPDGKPDPTRGFQMDYLDVSKIKHLVMSLYEKKDHGEISGWRMELPSDIIQRFPKFFKEMGNERWIVTHGRVGGKWLRTGEQASLDCLTYALAGAFYGVGGLPGRKDWDAGQWAARRAELAAARAGDRRGGQNTPPPPLWPSRIIFPPPDEIRFFTGRRVPNHCKTAERRACVRSHARADAEVAGNRTANADVRQVRRRARKTN